MKQILIALIASSFVGCSTLPKRQAAPTDDVKTVTTQVAVASVETSASTATPTQTESSTAQTEDYSGAYRLLGILFALLALAFMVSATKPDKKEKNKKKSSKKKKK